jgi:hypothetical protein
MSDRSRYNRGVKNYSGTYLKKGEFNAWCDRCGVKYKSSQLTKEWDELWVCPGCFEDRQPQDMVRGQVDLQATPWARPEVPDNFLLVAAITGLTTQPFAPGSEVVWDYANTLTVQVSGGTLASSGQLSVMNGANLCAVMNAGGGDELANPPAPSWEILQFSTATLVSPATYALTGLLRARYGTEGAMNLGTLPSGSPFVLIGNASASNDAWIAGYLDWLKLPYSPCYIGGFNDNGDQWFTWMRRSRLPPLWNDDWNGNGGTNFAAPLDEIDERYEVDVLKAGVPVRTLHAFGQPAAVYPLADQILDFGAVQSTYTVNVYQTDQVLGRGQGRQAAVSVTLGPAFDTLGDGLGNTLTDTLGDLLIGGLGLTGTPFFFFPPPLTNMLLTSDGSPVFASDVSPVRTVS